MFFQNFPSGPLPNKTSVLVQPVEFEWQQLWLADVMFAIILSLFCSI